MVRFFLFPLMLCSLFACTGMPEGVKPVDNFNLDKYQGIWYEIARLDHSFETGLEQVTAEYQLMPDGIVKVTNRGFSTKHNAWNVATGKAKFVEREDIGFLKVSFFGPFYASYVIFELDAQYQYSFVTGPNTSYLWLLSRTPNPDKAVINKFMALSKDLGFDTSDIIFPKHTHFQSTSSK